LIGNAQIKSRRADGGAEDLEETKLSGERKNTNQKGERGVKVGRSGKTKQITAFTK